MKKLSIILSEFNELITTKFYMFFIQICVLCICLIAGFVVSNYFLELLGSLTSGQNYTVTADGEIDYIKVVDALVNTEIPFSVVIFEQEVEVDEETNITVWGRYAIDQDEAFKRGQIAVSRTVLQQLGESLNVGDTIMLLGNVYEIGTTTQSYALELSYELFERDGFQADRITVFSDYKISRAKINQVNSKLRELGEIQMLYPNSAKDEVLVFLIYMALICIILLYCISIVLLIFRAWNYDNITKYMIYKINGCRTGTLLTLIFGKGCIIAILSYGISSIVFLQLSKWLEQMGILFDGMSFIGVTIGYFIIILGCLGKESYKICKANPVDKTLRSFLYN